MHHALVTMLELQHRMNTRVHPQWISQGFEWYRAIWIECGELMDHQGYKWWKQQQPELEQVKLEVVDIWHFGLSALFRPDIDIQGLATEVAAELEGYSPQAITVHQATEALAEYALVHKGFSVTRFWDLLAAAGLDFDELYRAYVGKNVLNFFRQDHGYQDGSYRKLWDGREDNEHLVELVAALNPALEDFAEQLYRALSERYASAAA